MKNILYIAAATKIHICHFHLPYLKWFKDRGYTVHVASGDDFEDGDEKEVPYCDRLYLPPISRSPFRFGNFKAYTDIKKLIKENEYDLICCNTPVGGAIGRLAAREARKKINTKVIYISHGFHFYKGGPAIYKLYYIVEKLLAPLADALITLNTEDYEMAKSLCYGTNCKVYYLCGMGVDTKKYSIYSCPREQVRRNLGIPQNATLLVSVSEINKNKNLATTIKAMAALNDPNMYYVICGVGKMLDKDTALANKLGIGERVRFLGYRRDISDILHASDIFLFPSIREGFGIAGVEAMSAGLPVIASDIRGVHEYAINGYNSILLDPHDVNGFSEAVKLLRDNKELREKYGTNARQSIEKCDIESSMKRLTSIFKRFLKLKK